MTQRLALIVIIKDTRGYRAYRAPSLPQRARLSVLKGGIMIKLGR
jgi:hypothetical protein